MRDLSFSKFTHPPPLSLGESKNEIVVMVISSTVTSNTNENRY